MTTLHEEPLSQRPLQEEPEDTYSDPEIGDYETFQEKPAVQNKMRMSSSKTMDSLLEITRTSSITNYVATTSVATAKVGNAGIFTPSMSSSSSSGYGSQAVSCTNLTNDDTFSLKSMCIDDTPDHDRSISTSPPNKRNDVIYTPGSGQKRFNPFDKKDKEEVNVVSPVRKILTPTKEHPLLNSKSEFSDEDEDEIIKVTDVNKNNALNDVQKIDNGETLTIDTNEFDDNQNEKNQLKNEYRNSATTNEPEINEELSGETLNTVESDEHKQIESEVIQKLSEKEIFKNEIPLPEWVVVGESVLIRPYNTSGVISFIGPTHFQVL